jgi:N-acetyl-anhydromuramyl-L-alanine amidase AmpD
MYRAVRYNGARLFQGLMTYLQRLSVVPLVALTFAASAVASPPQLAANTNYTQAQRPSDAIRFVVIHVSEGSFLGTVSWLRDPRAHASANFVVSRDGQVQQLVPLHDIA